MEQTGWSNIREDYELKDVIGKVSKSCNSTLANVTHVGQVCDIDTGPVSVPTLGRLIFTVGLTAYKHA